MTPVLHEKPHVGKEITIEKASLASSLDQPGATLSEKPEDSTTRNSPGERKLPRSLSKLLNALSIELSKRTNVLLSTTALALFIMCFRYVQWTRLTTIRDNCRARLASFEIIAPGSDCFVVLMGPRPPPPYIASASDGPEVFGEMMHEYLLGNTDGRFPSLWQALLFGNGWMPDNDMLLFAMVLLPMYANLILPTLLSHYRLQSTSAGLVDRFTWLYCYYAIGLTGIWIWFGELLCDFLKWSYGGAGLVAIDPTLVDVYEILATFIGWILAFTPASVSKKEDVKRDPKSLDLESKERAGNDVKDQSDNDTEEQTGNETKERFDNNTKERCPTTPAEVGIKSPPSANKLILAWRIFDTARLIPVTLIAGWRVLPATLLSIFTRIYLVDQIRSILERERPSLKRRILYLILWLMAMDTLKSTSIDLIERVRFSKSESDQLWLLQFQSKVVQRKSRSNFAEHVDKVIRGEATIETGFNSTELLNVYRHPHIGSAAFPEAWNRIRAFLEGMGRAGDEEYAWMRTEL
ncbi:hypothetical protein H2200_010802 [Cladophialophora chaetospira]|uniref:Uncharacterized protein n=1 Tax=Cladophialophora chaetospira TaxID=386627 RepID=A0AA39CDV7_9EURO|nr:hypothetical protein H2200_010802 [Cladophialophora chaetospira]